ncbi:MAG: response regulator transcription factor [Hymenobacter sp.]|nr:MAG: response regulator transcription factor [Hymenobacter sp.]
MFGADTICFDYFDARGNAQFLGAYPCHLFTPALLQAAAYLLPQHPLYEEVFVRGNTRPLRLTDFASVQEFQRTELYRASGLTYHLTMGTPVPGGLIMCAIFRQAPDFSRFEQTLLAFVQPHLAALLGQLPVGPGPAPGTGAPLVLGLTCREADILFHLANGRANKEIGQLCAISTRTVQNHLHNIYHKLGVDNRTAASLRAVSWLS